MRFTVSILAFVITCAPRFAEQSKSPNIIVVLADDLGYADVKTSRLL